MSNKDKREILSQILDDLFSFNVENILSYDEAILSEFKDVFINLFLKHPKLSFLFDRYLNSVDDRYTIKELLLHLITFMNMSNIKDRNYFHHNKLSKVNIKYEIYEKLKNENKDLDESELKEIVNYIYTLYRNDKVELPFESARLENDNSKNENKNRFKIEDLYKEIFMRVQRKKYCLNCPFLNKKDVVILDSNKKYIDEIDIVILGINPGEEERLQGKPFVGKSGKLLRSYLEKYFDELNIGYLITNVILCSTPNIEDLKLFEKDLLSSCKYYQDIIDFVKPKVILGFGKQVALSMKIGFKSYKNNPYYYNDIPVFILYHPSYILRNRSKENEFREMFENAALFIYNLLKKRKFYPPKDRYIKMLNIYDAPPNLQYFTTKLLKDENKYIHIFTDSNGNKYYIETPFKHTIYIHKNRFPQDCEYLEDTNNLVKAEIYDYNTYKKLRYEMLKKLKEECIK